MYPKTHKRPAGGTSFERLLMLWERYPQYHEMTTFSTMEELIKEHESWQEDYDGIREEYAGNLRRMLAGDGREPAK